VCGKIRAPVRKGNGKRCDQSPILLPHACSE
jgi:hypothetical protein